MLSVFALPSRNSTVPDHMRLFSEGFGGVTIHLRRCGTPLSQRLQVSSFFLSFFLRRIISSNFSVSFRDWPRITHRYTTMPFFSPLISHRFLYASGGLTAFAIYKHTKICIDELFLS